MIIKVEHISSVSIYQQIYNSIISAIASGELPPGSSLPSIRQLAGDLGVNMLTVSKAYNLLKQDGYIMLNRRSGAVVSEVSAISKEEISEIVSRLTPIVNAACAKGMSKETLMRLCEQTIDTVFDGN